MSFKLHWFNNWNIFEGQETLSKKNMNVVSEWESECNGLYVYVFTSLWVSLQDC